VFTGKTRVLHCVAVLRSLCGKHVCVYCVVLYCVPVYCSVVQCGAVWCSALQYVFETLAITWHCRRICIDRQEFCKHTPCNTLQHPATHCNTLQHPATHCNTLQQASDTAWTSAGSLPPPSIVKCVEVALQWAVALQHTATHCNTQ